MKQTERASIMRIALDLVRADAIIDLHEIEFIDVIRHKYGISREDEVSANSLTLSEAIENLRYTPDSLRQDLLGDLQSVAFSDQVCTREEALLMLSILFCLRNSSLEQSMVCSVLMPADIDVDAAQVLYVEGDYYKEINANIHARHRDIVNELRLIGLNFVYIPRVAEHYRTLSVSDLDSFISFLYPGISIDGVEKMKRQLLTLNTSDFCKEIIVGKMKLNGLEHSLPSVLLFIGKSEVDGKNYENFLVVSLDDDVLASVRRVVDAFVAMYKPRVLNLTYEERSRFVCNGFYKQIFDSVIYQQGVKSRVVVDFVHGDILLPEIDTKLQLLHRREKALYTLFLLESPTGGVNFNKPDESKSLNKYNHRMEVLQHKYEIIYENFGGERDSAPDITQGENRRPMISLIKKQFCKLDNALAQVDNYLIQRNMFGNYCVQLPPELCLLLDVQTGRTAKFSESEYWMKVLAL